MTRSEATIITEILAKALRTLNGIGLPLHKLDDETRKEVWEHYKPVAEMVTSVYELAAAELPPRVRS